MIEPGQDNDRRNVRRVRRVLVIAALFALLVVLAAAHPFLAPTSPSGEGLLVVEAWIPQQSLADAARIFREGRYDYLVVVGGPIKRPSSASGSAVTYADSAETAISAAGIEPAKIVKVPVGPSRNRTYSMAAAVRDWIRSSETNAHSVDVFTAGVHARKSWVLFRHALGDNYRVGIIAGPEHSYDPRFWPASRRGLWIVSRNIAGYLYSEVEIALDAHGFKVLSAN